MTAVWHVGVSQGLKNPSDDLHNSAKNTSRSSGPVGVCSLLESTKKNLHRRIVNRGGNELMLSGLRVPTCIMRVSLIHQLESLPEARGFQVVGH